MSRIQKPALWAAAIFSILIAIGSWRFMLLGVAQSMPAMAAHLDPRPLALYAHITLAPVALFLLPFQFNTKLRNGNRALHRWLGRLYALAILISGVAGLFLAIGTEAGPIAGAGFGILAVLWLVTTAQAVRFAMQRQIAQHKRWIIRSAALTFAAVTLRLYLAPLSMGLGFETGYLIVAWACWVPNLIVAELWLARRMPISQIA